MDSAATLSPGMIQAAFEEEITALGGLVSDVCQAGECLYARGILPPECEVGPDDRVRGGVAIRAGACDVEVFPYVFRQVCRNGAIMARAIEGLRLEVLRMPGPAAALEAVREAVQACASERTFEDSARAMRSTRNTDMDVALMMLSQFGRRGMRGTYFRDIMARLERSAAASGFAVMNAVTSLARDTPDPGERWRLEELGGAIAMAIEPHRPSPAPASRRRALV